MTKHNESAEQVAYKTNGQEEPINWLKDWSVIEDKAINSKAVEIKQGIEIYVLGWLAKKNLEKNTNFRVEKFELKEVIGSPGKFTASVFLDPPVTQPPHTHEGEGEEDEEIGGGHLVPPPPPPPGER